MEKELLLNPQPLGGFAGMGVPLWGLLDPNSALAGQVGEDRGDVEVNKFSINSVIQYGCCACVYKSGGSCTCNSRKR